MVENDPTPDGWAKEAQRYAESALALRKLMPRQAYSMAGLGVECAIKSLIMRRNGLNRWPGRSERGDLYVHNFEQLLRIAGLLQDVEAEIRYVTEVGVAWVVAKEFSMASRYPDKPLSAPMVDDMVDAAERLVAWLLMM
ncbi:hypothetical protein [Siccirubricoccus phaeus]|uniref:hypothetical protein n=1 Tax=Siccirubricoccus phaeus TaxID=2595053 RepID=UPI0011F1B60E|nr:hypothetical protein [Siccirubricoccus phaeus]